MSLARTATLSLVDQGIASASNLLVVVVAARNLGVRDFGIFSLALLIYSVLVPAVQAIVGQELQLRTGTEVERRRASASAIRASLALGGAFGVLLLGVAVVAPGSVGALVVLALCLPLLATQEVIRSAAVVCDAVHIALVSDLIWLVLALLLAVLVETDVVTATPTWAVLAWGASGCIAALAVVAFFFKWGSEPGGRYLSRTFVGYRFLLEFLLMRGTSQALILALGAVAGVVALGAFRGATSLLGPLTVAVLSIANFGAPLAARVHRDQWPRLAVAGSASVVSGVSIYTCALLLLPARWGDALLGASWESARSLLLPLAVVTASTGISTVFTALIRLLEPRRTLTLRAISAALMPPLFAAGYWVRGVEGAAWGLASATVVQASMMVIQFRRLRATADQRLVTAS
jgi:O-antigen/teichoic acid export membrane protein